MGTYHVWRLLEMAEIGLKLLLTGGTGFLGSSLVRGLSHIHKFVVLVRNESNLSRIENDLDRVSLVNLEGLDMASFFEAQCFDGVIHCATNYGKDENSLSGTIEANLTLPLTLLQNALNYRVRCFINTDTVLDKRISHYSLSKSHFKDWLMFFSRGIKSINMELEHFYGRGDDPSKFVSNIVRQLVLNEDKKIALTKGEQKRSFIHINDVVSAFAVILKRLNDIPEGFNLFQVGSRNQVSIRSIVSLASQLCGNTRTTLDFGALPYRENEAMEVSLDVSGLEALGWMERVSLRDGLLDVIKHQRDRKTTLQ